MSSVNSNLVLSSVLSLGFSVGFVNAYYVERNLSLSVHARDTVGHFWKTVYFTVTLCQMCRMPEMTLSTSRNFCLHYRINSLKNSGAVSIENVHRHFSTLMTLKMTQLTTLLTLDHSFHFFARHKSLD